MEESPKRWGLILVVLAIALIVGGGVYLFFGARQTLVSPVPVEPSFKVIYYTPTPGAVTPTSTPSGTPKVKATPTKVTAPTVTVSPTKAGSPSATPIP